MVPGHKLNLGGDPGEPQQGWSTAAVPLGEVLTGCELMRKAQAGLSGGRGRTRGLESCSGTCTGPWPRRRERKRRELWETAGLQLGQAAVRIPLWSWRLWDKPALLQLSSALALRARAEEVLTLGKGPAPRIANTAPGLSSGHEGCREDATVASLCGPLTWKDRSKGVREPALVQMCWEEPAVPFCKCVTPG